MRPTEPASGCTKALAARRCTKRSGSRTGALRCLGQAARHLAQVAQQSGHRVAPAFGQSYAAWARTARGSEYCSCMKQVQEHGEAVRQTGGDARKRGMAGPERRARRETRNATANRTCAVGCLTSKDTASSGGGVYEVTG